MKNPMTLRLVIRGLESKIESITEAGRRQEADARYAGQPYDTKRMARHRVNLKRMIRGRIQKLQSKLDGSEA